MKDSIIIGFLTAIALFFMGAIAWSFRDRVFTGHNDFVQLYSGARLAGTSGLYDAEAVRRVQEERIGVTGESWRYTRLPYYAALLWPLGRLPYRTAYAVWELLAMAALVAFVWIWTPTAKPISALFTALSLPVFTALMNGQDLTFVLLWIALAVYWMRQGKPLQAGLILSLCAVKFHLFVLLPVLIVGQHQWRLGKGLLAGGAVLSAISFAVAGLDWPRAYLAVLTDPAIHPGTRNMANLHGLFSLVPAPPALEWLFGAVVVAMVWIVARRMAFEYALAATLAGGLLLSYHSYLPDCSVLLPAALIAVSKTRLAVLRALAVLLLTPVAYFMLMAPTLLAAAVPVATLAFVVLMALESWRQPRVV